MNFWHIQLDPGKKKLTSEELKKIVEDYSVIGMGDQWDNDGGAPNRFENDVSIGDIFIIRHSGSPRYLVEVIDDCKKNEGENIIEAWFPLYRKIRIIDGDGVFYKEKYNKTGKNWTDGLYSATTFQTANNWEFASYWYDQIKNKELIKKNIQLLTANHNLILTGAPGTGKTYLAKQIAEEIVSQEIKGTPMNILLSAIDSYIIDEKQEQHYNKLLTDFRAQFPIENLQNLTLENYCIGNSDENKKNFCYWIERKLKPLGYYFPGSSRSYLLYWNKSDGEYKVHGYLKQEKDKSNEELMSILASDIYQMVKGNNPLSMAKKYGESFILKILSTYYPDQYAPINSKNHIDNIISLFDIKCESKNVFERNKAIFDFYKELTKGKNISPWSFMHILYDNFNIKEGEVIQEGIINNNGDYYLVQFHPSYDYTDFVEGLRPINKEENNDISFVLQDGIFKKLCVTASRNPNKKYVMIIDEINRGEISKIFGELFFSIDPGYRGKKGKVLTQYANMQNNPNEFDLSLNIDESEDYGHFFVPENVYIIGTMNDIDRSVESMDFAFRRRFAFKEIRANETQNMLDKKESWKDEKGNSAIPDPSTIAKIKNRMDNLNNVIWNDNTKSGIEGLSSAYHIGASYFLKLANYRNNGAYDDSSFKNLWDYHLEGLLREYLRGMQDVDTLIEDLNKAYNNESAPNRG